MGVAREDGGLESAGRASSDFSSDVGEDDLEDSSMVGKVGRLLLDSGEGDLEDSLVPLGNLNLPVVPRNEGDGGLLSLVRG